MSTQATSPTPISERRLAANRANAQRSTGPRTAKGKEASRLNALRHGLTAKTILLQVEDPDEYDAFCEEIHATFNPAPGAETYLTQELAEAKWRLQRTLRVETAATDHYLDTRKHQTVPDDEEHRDALSNDVGLALLFDTDSDDHKVFDRIGRYVTAADRRYSRLLGHLIRMQQHRERLELRKELALAKLPQRPVEPEPEPVAEPAPLTMTATAHDGFVSQSTQDAPVPVGFVSQPPHTAPVPEPRASAGGPLSGVSPDSEVLGFVSQ